MTAFVNAHVNAAEGAGKELAQKFNVHGLPTLLVVDAAGSEIDRIVGYLPPAKFTPEIQRILKGEGTLPALKKKVADSPDDLGSAVALAKKLVSSAPADAMAMLEGLTVKAKGKDAAVEKDAWLALVSATAQSAGADSEHALAVMDRARKESGSPEVGALADRYVVRFHLQAVSAALRRQAQAAGDDAQALNVIAWNCFELKMNVRDAIGWAKKAVDLSKRDPAILDTLANLQFATGNVADAIEIETEAVAKAKPAALKAELAQTLAKFTLASAAQAAGAAAKPQPAGAEADEDGEGDEGDEGNEADEPNEK